MRTTVILAVAVALLLSSCATYNVYEAKSSDEPGVRFYRPWPYLVVKAGENNTLSFEMLYLPDRSKEYIVKRKGFIGSSNMTLKLEHGWNLIEFGSTSDSKVPETLGSLASLLPALGVKADAKDAKNRAASAYTLKPGLYKVTFNASGAVQGLVAVQLF